MLRSLCASIGNQKEKASILQRKGLYLSVFSWLFWMRSEIWKTDNTVNKEYRGNRKLPVVNLQLEFFTRHDNRHRRNTNKQRRFSSEPMATNRFFKIYLSPLSLFASFGSDIVPFRHDKPAVSQFFYHRVSYIPSYYRKDLLSQIPRCPGSPGFLKNTSLHFLKKTLKWMYPKLVT